MKINRKARIGLAVASSVALIGAAGAAYAAGPPWVVSAGSSSSGSAAYSAHAPGDSANPAVNFVAGAAAMDCESADAAGVVSLGSTSGDFASVSSASFHDCKALGLVDMEVVELPGESGSLGDWVLAVSGDAVSGVSPGNVHRVHAHVQDVGTGGSVCSLDADGLVSASFDANSQQLVVDGDELDVSNVVGCFGLVNDPDNASFSAAYDVKNEDNPLDLFSVAP